MLTDARLPGRVVGPRGILLREPLVAVFAIATFEIVQPVVCFDQEIGGVVDEVCQRDDANESIAKLKHGDAPEHLIEVMEECRDEIRAAYRRLLQRTYWGRPS